MSPFQTDPGASGAGKNANVISIIIILAGFPVAWQLAPRGPLILQPLRSFYKQGPAYMHNEHIVCEEWFL